MPQFLVFPSAMDPGEDTALLRGEEARHLAGVLRARPGEHVAIFDGEGRRWQGRVAAVERHEVRIAELAPLASNEPPVGVDLLQALPKGERWEWILEKGTELGARRFLPLLTARTVARLPAGRVDERVGRWRKIVLAAAKQCERGRVPEVCAPQELAACVENLGPAQPGDVRRFLSERERAASHVLPRSRPGAAEATPATGRIALAVGPEGGWSAQDRRVLAAAGFAPWSLGPRILRSETAAVAALAAVLARWGDLEPPDGP